MKKHVDIEPIKIEDFMDYEFIRTLDKKRVDEACQVIRDEILSVTSSRGGHLSSNLGVVELTVALHRSFAFPRDKLLFDVGHQCYAHKILTGRDLRTLNAENGVIGFQCRKESPFDPYDAGHSSTALSAADAFRYARDMAGENYEIVAVVGDASIVNGLSFEALNNIGGKPGRLIVVLNDNDMSITPSVGGLGKFFRRISSAKAYLKLKKGFRRVLFRGTAGKAIYNWLVRVKNAVKRKLIPFNLFENIGFNYLGPIDGHNEPLLEKTFKKAKKSDKPVVIHVRTKKGKGYLPAEKDKTGYWHGVTPFDTETGEPKNLHPGYESWSHFYADLTETLMKEREDIVAVTAGTLKGSNFENVFAAFPKRAIELGIAEEHALTFSGALSLNGFHPVISIYSTFLQRAYDEISHDCARMGANLTLLVERAGLVGSNGETHQGIYDEGYLKSIPNVKITMPSSRQEAEFLYRESLGENGVFAIRVPREMVLEEGAQEDVSSFKQGFHVLEEGADKRVLVLAVGPNARALQELKALDEEDFTLIVPLSLFPIPSRLIEIALEYENVVLYDGYSTGTGFAESFMAKLCERQYRGKAIPRTLPNAFLQALNTQKTLQEYGLSPRDVLELAKSL